MAGGFLHLDIQGYGGLNIKEKGAALLKGEGNFRYRKDTIPRKRRERGPQVVPSPGQHTGADGALLTKLKELRLRIAQERGMPAFVVFHDASLEDMVRRRPKTTGEFAEIHGVGEVKLRELAEPFMELIARHEG